MTEEPLFGIEGTLLYLVALNPGRRPSGTCGFPMAREWENASLRCDEEDPGDWFKRIVRQVAGDADAHIDAVKAVLESCELADGLAVFATLSWDHGKITHFSMQVFVTPGTDLSGFLNGDECVPCYYRLDFSPRERGDLFSHPFAHVHSKPDGPPRFPWPFQPNSYLPLSFLEFVIINHHYEYWKRWLFFEHDKRFSSIPEDEPPLKDLFDLFQDEDQWSQLPERERLVRQIKRAARMSIEEHSRDLPVIDPEYLKLNYWTLCEPS